MLYLVLRGTEPGAKEDCVSERKECSTSSAVVAPVKAGCRT